MEKNQKEAIFDIIMPNSVQLVINNIDDSEAFASVKLNPTLTWVKFILTDDKPNKNKHRVPKEEFSNLILSGLYMPLKMAEKEIAEGHDLSRPIGVITHLREQGNTIVGLAAIWGKEFPNEVEVIKERYKKDLSLNISWEILHRTLVEEEDGVLALKDTTLRAATLVGIAAYQGRTLITEVAAEKQEDNTLEKQERKELEDKIESLKENKSKQANLITELEDTQLTDKIKEELKELREFKSEVMKEKERTENLVKIRASFEENKVKNIDELIDENEAVLLSLDEAAFSFMLNSIVKAQSLAEEESEENEENASENKSKVPNLKGETNSKTLSPKEIGKELRDRRDSNNG